MPTGTPARDGGPLAIHPHLTDRDRDILALLDEHQVLSSDQIYRLHFRTVRTCQLRLNTLRRLGLLDRFRYARRGGGTETWKWVLGAVGARFQAAVTNRPAPTDRAHREHVLRLSARPDLGHLLATNEFFVRLHHTARTTPGPGHRPEVLRWWSEQAATAQFSGIQPDGHGLWGHAQRAEDATGFFLECDTGSEPLSRLIAKLDGYARLSTSGGPRYPVLFWLPSSRREDNLQRILRETPPPRGIPVATATHNADPAEAIWLSAAGTARQSLIHLHSNHGPQAAGNPNWRGGQLDLSNQRPPDQSPPRF